MARNRRPQHGGYREPNDPAPVSGPAGLSQRTDGGPSQPVRHIPSSRYGQGVELEQMQRAAPMAQATPAGAAGPPSAGAPGGGPLSAFGPTMRPNEPITAGLPVGPGSGPRDGPDPDDYLIALQVMYSLWPRPEIARLMMRSPGGGGRA